MQNPSVRVRFWDSGVQISDPGVEFWLVRVRFRQCRVEIWDRSVRFPDSSVRFGGTAAGFRRFQVAPKQVAPAKAAASAESLGSGLFGSVGDVEAVVSTAWKEPEKKQGG